tara:strand:- start:454 stop:1284 length:831 start_codon:yes stop_codon:yes gene_type:complete
MIRVVRNTRFRYYGKVCRIKAIAQLGGGGRHQKPHFSLTGDIINWRCSTPSTFGCIHPQIKKAFRGKFDLIEALHLSDEDGVPMHAVENAWYWAGGTEWNGDGKDNPPHVYHLANHLRIAWAEAERIVSVVGGRTLPSLAKSDLSAYIDALRPRWKAEAEEARAWLLSEPDDDPPPPPKTTRMGVKKPPKYFGQYRTKRDLIQAIKAANPTMFDRKTCRFFGDAGYDIQEGERGGWLFVTHHDTPGMFGDYRFKRETHWPINDDLKLCSPISEFTK